MIDLTTLRRIPLFRDFADEQLSQVLATVTERRYPKHQFVVREGDPGDTFFVIAAGSVVLFDYLGFPFEEQCLRFYENKRPVVTQSSEQVRQPLYTSGMGQWRAYEHWLGPLKTALGAVLDEYPQVPE